MSDQIDLHINDDKLKIFRVLGIDFCEEIENLYDANNFSEENYDEIRKRHLAKIIKETNMTVEELVNYQLSLLSLANNYVNLGEIK